MKKLKAISADSHVNEPPDIFKKFFPAKLQDRAPKIVDLDNGGQAWQIEGTDFPIPFSPSAVNYRSQKRFDRSNYKEKFLETKDGVKRGVRYEDIMPGSWDPTARLEEQDEDHVDGEVLYNSPQIWGAVKEMDDPELQLACFKAYNNWMAEFCAHDPERLIGVGLVPVTGVDDAIAEMQRCVDELKLPTVAIESYPSGDYLNPSKEDDKFWAAARELDIPVSLHLSISVPASAARSLEKGDLNKIRKATASGHYAKVFEKLVLTGVFDRFPELIFVGAEVNGAWVPHYLETFDRNFIKHADDLPVRPQLRPSDYFARNAYITFIIDQVAVNNRHLIGVDRMMWNSDFPHSVSNWPIDVELAEAQMKVADVPTDEWDRMLWRTCADLYKIPYASDAGVERIAAQ